MSCSLPSRNVRFRLCLLLSVRQGSIPWEDGRPSPSGLARGRCARLRGADPALLPERESRRAVRNAYGTQVDSFVAPVDAGAAEGLEGLRCVFIRAPRLRDLGPDVEVLARVDGEPVLLRQGNCFAATFHPELTADPRVHALLLGGVAMPLAR